MNANISSQLSTIALRVGLAEGNISNNMNALKNLNTSTISMQSQLSSQLSALTIRVGLTEANISNNINTLATLGSRMSASESTLSTMMLNMTNINNRLVAIDMCSSSGMLYSQANKTCISSALNLAPYDPNLSCNNSTYGSIRLWNSNLHYCNGQVWNTAPRNSIGSDIVTPAASCSSIVMNGDYKSALPYYIQQLDGSVILQACNGSTNLGGDGLTTQKVAFSCASVSTYFNISNTKVYIDANLNSSSAVQVYCLKVLPCLFRDATFVEPRIISCRPPVKV